MSWRIRRVIFRVHPVTRGGITALLPVQLAAVLAEGEAVAVAGRIPSTGPGAVITTRYVRCIYYSGVVALPFAGRSK